MSCVHVYTVFYTHVNTLCVLAGMQDHSWLPEGGVCRPQPRERVSVPALLACHLSPPPPPSSLPPPPSSYERRGWVTYSNDTDIREVTARLSTNKVGAAIQGTACHCQMHRSVHLNTDCSSHMYMQQTAVHTCTCIMYFIISIPCLQCV